jgi:hypothetical protein
MKKRLLVVDCSLALFLLLSGLALAALDDYGLDWRVIGGGSGAVAGRSYALDGAIVQPVAGAASGGSYALNAGFRQKDAPSGAFSAFLPLVLKG